MAGLLNHPKMPFIAGAVTLFLLGTGMYLSSQEGASEVDTPSSATHSVAAPAVAAAQPALSPEPQTPPVAAVAPVAPASPVSAVTEVAPALVSEAPVLNPVASNPTAPTAAAPTVAARPALVPPAAEAPTPAHTVGEIKEQQQEAAAKLQKLAPQRPLPAHLTSKPKRSATKLVAQPVAKDAKTPAASAARVEGEKPGDTDAHAAVQKENKTSNYTEIKAGESNQNLTAAKAAAKASSSPALVATSGDKAWVRVSATRTIVVKPGEDVPEIGKVIGVTSSELVTDKGKYTLNKE